MAKNNEMNTSGRSKAGGAERSLTVKPIPLADANAAVARWHRHHKPTVGHKFSLGLFADGELVGAAICGRPVARMEPVTTLEATRVVVREGVPNGCSKLYGAVRREGIRRGFRRVITYTLASESGKSLTAAGWRPVRYTKGGSWSRPSRGRTDKAPIVPKLRWEAVLP